MYATHRVACMCLNTARRSGQHLRSVGMYSSTCCSLKPLLVQPVQNDQFRRGVALCENHQASIELTHWTCTAPRSERAGTENQNYFYFPVKKSAHTKTTRQTQMRRLPVACLSRTSHSCKQPPRSPASPSRLMLATGKTGTGRWTHREQEAS